MRRVLLLVFVLSAGTLFAADMQVAKQYFDVNTNDRTMARIQMESAETLAAVGQRQNAFAARSTQLERDKKLNKKPKSEQTSRMRVQFDTEKKEQENRALLRENKLNADTL